MGKSWVDKLKHSATLIKLKLNLTIIYYYYYYCGSRLITWHMTIQHKCCDTELYINSWYVCGCLLRLIAIGNTWSLGNGQWKKMGLKQFPCDTIQCTCFFKFRPYSKSKYHIPFGCHYSQLVCFREGQVANFDSLMSFASTGQCWCGSQFNTNVEGREHTSDKIFF